MKRGFRNTSWQKVAPWYNKITRGGEGHYYHEHVIIPNVLRLLELNIKSQTSNLKLLDLACGNGVLAKHLPKSVKYTGVDLSESLVKYAKNEDKNYNHEYFVADITQPLNITPSEIAQSASHGTPLDAQKVLSNRGEFTHAAIILALQNIKDPRAVFENVSKFLIQNSKFIIILNHPMFRIPRQSAWGIDEERKIQYRRVDKYMSPMEIPIRMNPSDPQSEQTMSYHFPLSYYISALKDSGFLIEKIEEWTSDKESVGAAGRMENRSRSEIPLFMAILAKKV